MSRLAAGVLAVGMILASVGRPMVAQAPRTTILELGSDAQGPGAVALVSLSLRLAEGTSVGRVVTEISFPTRLLSFDGALRGLSADAVGARVSATPKESNGPDTTVEITVTAKEGEQLPPGTLAELKFKVRDEVTEEIKVPLKQKVAAWSEKTPPTPITAISGTDGEVEITKTPPVAACFFYMH